MEEGIKYIEEEIETLLKLKNDSSFDIGTVCSLRKILKQVKKSDNIVKPEEPVEHSYNVWMQGYAVTGQSEGAQYLGVYKGLNFKATCKAALESKSWDMSYYNEKTNSYWSCRFFENEYEARKTFG